MSDKDKKVLLIFVEGKSEKTALAHLFEDCFGTVYTVRIEYLDGDIFVKTPGRGKSSNGSYNSPQNIESQLTLITKKFMLKYGHEEKGGLSPSDFFEIVHITDTDGVFVDPSHVAENKSLTPAKGKENRILYTTDGIETLNSKKAIYRNEKKAATVNAAVQLGNLRFNNGKTLVPYRVFFMSCNLDHVLYDSINLPDAEKVAKAKEIRKRYLGDLKGYLEFLTESDFSLVGYTYESSWEFIQKGLNSLNRYTNIGIYFNQ